MKYFMLNQQIINKQKNILTMNKKFYLVLIPLLIAGCGNKEEKETTDIVSPIVNSAIVDISEVVGVGKVEPEDEIISLAAAAGGVVKEIYHYDGDSITIDEPLVRLDDELELIRVNQLRSQVASQKSQIEIDRLNLNESEVRLANKKKLLESVKKLAEKGAESIQTLDDLETEVTALKLAVEKNTALVKLSESRLGELTQQLRYADAEAERKILRSPYNGILLELHIEKGRAVNQFEPFAEVAPSGPLTVKTEVDELFASRLSNGLDAEIRYVGSDSAIAHGTVIFVSPYLKKKSLFSEKASEQEDRLVREVRIKLDENAGLILNSKVEAVILLKNN
jgi:multidrug resistance efflux pump